MKQYFEHFIRFFRPNAQDGLKNLYEPREPVGEMLAKKGDTWRFLVPVSDIGLNVLSTLRVDLYGFTGETCTSYGLIKAEAGYLRKQQSEFYYEFVIKVNNSPTNGQWRQFSIDRNGEVSLFGTFESQETDFDTYINLIVDWLEGYPHTRVDVIRDGNLLRVRAWENGNFRIRNENISIGIGTISVLNTNTPTLKKQFVQTYERPTFITYDLVVGEDVTEGNIFTFDSTIYTATKADTAATVKTALLGTATAVKYDVGTPVDISVSLGVKRTVNTNNPKIVALYQTTESGQDKYRIEVESIAKGNIFQVLISGESPIFVEVSGTDTVSTVEALLNPSSGFLSVTAGATVTVNAVLGIREDANTNNPQIYVDNGVLTDAVTVDQYKIYVGTSVRENNKFVLDNLEVVADANDTYLTIATKLQLIDGECYEVATTTEFECYAQKGGLYTDENIADIQVISSPIRRKSTQLICEVTFPTNLINGRHQIYLNKYDEELVFVETIAVSSYIKIDQLAKHTAMLRYSDIGEAFGYDYFEEGLVQEIRVPIFLKNEKNETTQVVKQSVNDATIKGQTTIRKTFDFDVKSNAPWFHRALVLALNHKNVFIDDRKISLIDYSDDDTDGLRFIKTASGKLYQEDYLLKNFGKLWLSNNNYYEKVSVKANFKEKIVALVVYNNYFRKEILEEGEIYLPVGEYKWKVFVAGAGGDTVTMKMYHNGHRVQDIILLCNRWNKSDFLFRAYPADEIYFEEVKEENAIDAISTNLENDISFDSVEYANEIGTETELNGYVIERPLPALTTQGQWRYSTDGDGNLTVEVYQGEDWVIMQTIA